MGALSRPRGSSGGGSSVGASSFRGGGTGAVSSTSYCLTSLGPKLIAAPDFSDTPGEEREREEAEEVVGPIVLFGGLDFLCFERGDLIIEVNTRPGDLLLVFLTFSSLESGEGGDA